MSIQDETSGNDGYQDVFWNLGQVIAWAGTRRPDAVDALSSSTAKMTRRPHSIVSGMPVLAMEGFVPEAEDKDDKLGKVLDQVLRAFQSGALNASGARSIGDPREMIPPLEWIDLVFDLSLDGEMPVRHREGRKSLWCDVRVHRDEALREFPGTNMAEVEAIEKDKGGRPREYDWDAVKAYALALVQEHGRPGKGNRRLPTKSQLVDAILNEWASKDLELKESTVRRHVGEWLKEL